MSVRKSAAIASLIIVAGGALGACNDSNGPTAPQRNCTGSSTPLALAVGAVHRLTTQELCAVTLDAGAGAEYVLVPFFASLTSSAHLQLDVLGENVGNVSGPPNPQVGPVHATTTLAAHPGRISTASPRRDVQFDLQLRERERRLLMAHATSARAWFALRAGPDAPPRSGSPRPSRTLVTSGASVGDRVSVNVQANQDCTNPQLTTARVAAITTHAIVLADTANPSGGFSDTEYQAFGAQFDTLVHPLDTDAFGDPADIDNNDRVVILFTRAVNALTPANSDFFVGGFFFGRDLLPTAECPGSNLAEMFYMLVPDPTGTINQNKRTKGFVDSLTAGTLVHEYQHLINASRRLYVNTGADPAEEVWLNEGLSHIAEGLAFFRESGLSPRQNIDSATLRSSARVVDAFNFFQSQNFARLLQYIDDPESTGPYRSDDNDDLNTRGATWEFLRYAADRKATMDGTIWFDLVNSTTSGIANFENVFGADIRDWVADFTVAQYADDAGLGVSSEFTLPTWNFREVFRQFDCCTKLPLTVTQLPNNTVKTTTLSGGGTAYFRFAEGGGDTSVGMTSQGQPVPTELRAVIVRTK
ncbi:MAG TPA: hypothetical protein VFK13_00985 [Gemmatimonadaceae bacterium]|nr:hypothetical protein [Gemmatimonadaceae bacterium]